MVEALILLAGLVIGASLVFTLRRRSDERQSSGRRILFPYVGSQLSTSALDSALRIARIEEATLVPAYLAPVPMALPLEAPIPRSCSQAF